MHIKNTPFHCFGVNCFQTNCELVANFVIYISVNKTKQPFKSAK